MMSRIVLHGYASTGKITGLLLAAVFSVALWMPVGAAAGPGFNYEKTITISGPTDETFGKGSQIAVGNGGLLYVADNVAVGGPGSEVGSIDVFSSHSSGNAFIQKIVGDGHGEKDCLNPSNVNPVPSKYKSILSIAADPGPPGHIYLLDGGKKRIYELSGPGDDYSLERSFCTLDEDIEQLDIDLPTAIDAYAPGRLYISGLSQGSGITSGAGVVSLDMGKELFLSSLNMSYVFPMNITAAKGDFIYVVDMFLNRILAYRRSDSADGKPATYIPVDDKPIGKYSSGSGGAPTAVAIDSLGRVYVSELNQISTSGGGRVTVLSSYEDGFKTLNVIDGVQTASGYKAFNSPSDVVVDGTRVYVRDVGAGVHRLRYDDENVDGVFDTTQVQNPPAQPPTPPPPSCSAPELTASLAHPQKALIKKALTAKGLRGVKVKSSLAGTRFNVTAQAKTGKKAADLTAVATVKKSDTYQGVNLKPKAGQAKLIKKLRKKKALKLKITASYQAQASGQSLTGQLSSHLTATKKAPKKPAKRSGKKALNKWKKKSAPYRLLKATQAKVVGKAACQ